MREACFELAGKDKSWKNMTGAEQAAAGVLGYDGESWDAGATPPACTQLWRELRRHAELLAAALALGYTESEWDAELHAGEMMDHGLMDSRRPYAAAAAAAASSSAPDEGDDGPLQSHFNGVPLILSAKSGTGYKGVCQRGENRFAVTLHGKCEGSFATAVEAAAKYAELVSTNGSEMDEDSAMAGAVSGCTDPLAACGGHARHLCDARDAIKWEKRGATDNMHRPQRHARGAP